MDDVKFIQDMHSSMLIEAAKAAKHQLKFSTAFLKATPFEQICRTVQNDNPKAIITRWQFCDLVNGASDLEAYIYARDFGWDFYFNQDLHAKLYLFDDQAIIGSSNLTNRGFGGGPPSGNIELSVQFRAGLEVMDWFDHLICDSNLIDDDLYSTIVADVMTYKETQKLLPTIRKGFSQKVTDVLRRRGEKGKLYLHDFPQTFDPNHLVGGIRGSCHKHVFHDMNLLGLPNEPKIVDIKKAFEISPSFSWLYSVTESPRFFGELAARLHDMVTNEPKPYRKEIKERLGNLINWAVVLCPDIFLVESPRYSQRISRIVD